MLSKRLVPVAVGVATLLCAPRSVGATEVPTIGHRALVDAVKMHSVVLLDMNGTTSYRAGHIPGALNYVEVEFTLRNRLPRDKGALIVVYGADSFSTTYKRGADEVRKFGYTNVKHYFAGLKGWKDAGEKVEKS